jgi:hypothetical protein
MTSPRRRGLAAVAQGLGPRDWAVLHDLATVRLLTGRQVQRLHVADGSTLTQARRGRALLQRLHDLGLLHRLDRRVGGINAGSSGFVYGLSAAGQRLTTNAGPAGGRRLRRPWEPASTFVDHILAVSELYVVLREEERAGRLELLRFQAEPACWRRWSGANGEPLILKPDASVVLGVGDYEEHRFIEMDRSTESRTVLRRKVMATVDYWHAGFEQRGNGVFPRTLWLVLDEKRKAQLVDVFGALPPETWPLFEIGLHHEALRHLGQQQPTPEGGDDA